MGPVSCSAFTKSHSDKSQNSGFEAHASAGDRHHGFLAVLPSSVKDRLRRLISTPPQTPILWPMPMAWSKHSSRTGHQWQIAMARRRSRERPFPLPSGWKIFLSCIFAHVPSDCQELSVLIILDVSNFLFVVIVRADYHTVCTLRRRAPLVYALCRD